MPELEQGFTLSHNLALTLRSNLYLSAQVLTHMKKILSGTIFKGLELVTQSQQRTALKKAIHGDIQVLSTSVLTS